MNPEAGWIPGDPPARRIPGRAIVLSGLSILLALALSGPRARAEKKDSNLVVNGSFDEGAKDATKIPGWTEVDGLTTFFVTDPDRGRVLKFDTDVNLSEANARWKEMALPKAKRPPARPKGKTKPPKYDTVAGTTGAKIYSDFFRVEPGMRYRLTVDAKSDGPELLVFVKGYARFQGGFRKFYQCYKKVPAHSYKWHTYERTFNPTLHSPKVTHIRVMPYAYWPPGQAWVDDVRVTRVGPEKAPPPAPGKNLLENGDFEKPTLAPFTARGPVSRIERGSAGAAVRIGAGGELVSGMADVEEKRSYVLRARILSVKAVLVATVEGLVMLDGKWYVLYTGNATSPPAGKDWVKLEYTFCPTKDTPQVAKVRVRFTVTGKTGNAYVDDVSISPQKETEK